MENKQLNSQESLELIQRMIDSTRTRYEKNGGSMFLIWGYTSIAVAVLYALARHFTGNPVWGWVWWAIPVVGWSITWATAKSRVKTVTTYVDRVVNTVWAVVGAFAVAFPLAAMFSWPLGLSIIPIEAMLLCMGVIMTGALIKVRSLLICGMVAALLSFLMFFTSGDYWVYIFAAMFAVGMVIPGHILNHRARCSKN